ncbi:MAG: PD-(D/E)XK nuclease family protein [Polyangiaceae bacterium]
MSSDANGELFIAPSLHAAQRIAHVGGRAETLATLRRRLAAKLAPQLVLASAEASRMALADALGSLPAREFSSRGASRARSVEAFDAALGALFSAGTTIGALERIARLRGSGSERAGLLAKAMAGTIARLAAAGLIDRRLLPVELATAIARSEPQAVVGAVGVDRVIARLVVAWQPADIVWWRALDSALARVGGFAKIELPLFSKKMDAERERDPLELLIDDLAQKLDAPPDTIVIESRFGDLRFAGDEKPGNVDLRRASNANAQARAIADAVVTAMRNGAHTEEIAIVLPELDDTSIAPIARLFSQIGIPFHLPQGAAPVHAPIVRVALSALSFVSEEASRVELRALEESPFIRGDVRALLTRARAAHSADASWKKRIAVVRALCANLELADQPTKAVKATFTRDQRRSELDALELQAHADNARALRALHASIDAIEASAARLKILGKQVDATEFSRTLERSLEASTMSPASSLAGAVFLGRLSDVTHEPLALLVVADANEGVLPPFTTISPVVTEAVATKLREVDSARAPLSSYVQHAAIWAALAASASRAQNVVVTYRTQGGEGDALGPSPLVAWLLRAGVSETDWHSGPLAGAPLDPSEARLRNLAFHEETRPTLAPNAARRAQIELARETYHSTHVTSAVVGDVSSSPESLALLERSLATADRPLSITALEHLARCNFRGFSRSILGVREPEAASEAPDARERGLLLHAALRAAFEATMPMWSVRPRDHEAIRARALEAAESSLLIAELADEFSSTRVVLRGVVHRQIIQELLRILDFSLADETWDAAHAEQPFGRAKKEGSWPALALEHEGATAHLQGEIDRVDIMHGERSRVRAVDYKASVAVSKDAHRTLGDTTLQVPLYARAAMVALDAQRAEGLYLPSRDIPAALASRPKFEAQWEKIGAGELARTDLAVRTLAIVEPARKGNLMPRPHDDNFAVCDRCAYDGICRRPRFVVTEDDNDEESSS